MIAAIAGAHRFPIQKSFIATPDIPFGAAFAADCGFQISG
jgi:hypothetical protein